MSQSAEVFRGPAITGIGMSVPDQIVTNKELINSYRIDSSEQWIRERTGIRERRISGLDDTTTSLAQAAAAEALATSGMSAAEINQILVATVTSNHHFPSTASLVQAHIEASSAIAMDLAAACAGGLFALASAYDRIQAGNGQSAIVVGADRLSTLVDRGDRSTCILFGDGAGAVAVQQIENPGTFAFALYSNPEGNGALIAPQGAHIRMEGGVVYNHAVRGMQAASEEVMQRAGFTIAGTGELDVERVKLFVPHQANLRIMENVAGRLGMSGKLFQNVEHYGNTSAASNFIALYEAWRRGMLEPGDYVLLASVGAGFAYGAAIVQWHLDKLEDCLATS